MKSSKHLDCCPSTFTSRKHGSPDSWLWKLYTGSQATWILYTVLLDLIAHFFLSEYAIFNNDTVFYIKNLPLLNNLLLIFIFLLYLTLVWISMLPFTLTYWCEVPHCQEIFLLYCIYWSYVLFYFFFLKKLNYKVGVNKS